MIRQMTIAIFITSIACMIMVDATFLTNLAASSSSTDVAFAYHHHIHHKPSHRCHLQKKQQTNDAVRTNTLPWKTTTKATTTLLRASSTDKDDGPTIVDQSTIKSIDQILFYNNDDDDDEKKQTMNYDAFCHQVLGCSTTSENDIFNNQFHNDDDDDSTPFSFTTISPPHFKIGLTYNPTEWKTWKESFLTLDSSSSDDDDNTNHESLSLQHYGCSSYQIVSNDHIQLHDSNGNIFDCRSLTSSIPTKHDDNNNHDTLVSPTVSYMEFKCPEGTATKISEFYDCVFDATTSVIEIENDDNGKATKICIVAIGNINDYGQSDQSLLFREDTQQEQQQTESSFTTCLPKITLTVGDTIQDYKQALQNAKLTGIVELPPKQNNDDNTNEQTTTTTVEILSFQFHDIVDMETGQLLMKLSHDIQQQPQPKPSSS